MNLKIITCQYKGKVIINLDYIVSVTSGNDFYDGIIVYLKDDKRYFPSMTLEEFKDYIENRNQELRRLKNL